MTSSHESEIPGLFDTSKVADTPEHWARLAERITAHATRSENGVQWLARSRMGGVPGGPILRGAVVVLFFAPRAETRRSGRAPVESARGAVGKTEAPMRPASERGRA